MGREVSFMHRKDRRWCSNQGKKMCSAPLTITFLLFLFHVIEVSISSLISRGWGRSRMELSSAWHC